MSKVKRHCIYPKDIVYLTGKSERYGRSFLNKIKKHFGKEHHQFISPDEFSEYSGIKIDVIDKYLKGVS
jgi:hypothetical protein